MTSDPGDPFEHFLVDRKGRKLALALIGQNFAHRLLQDRKRNLVPSAGRHVVVFQIIKTAETGKTQNI